MRYVYFKSYHKNYPPSLSLSDKKISYFSGRKDMNSQIRTNLVLGVLLFVVGLLYLASRFVPGLNLVIDFSWPWIVVAVGVGLLLLGLLIGVPEMAIPASIVSGIGGILYYQNNTGNWASWAYAWALIPVFVGIGMIISALLGGRGGRAYLEATETIGSGLVLFVIIGSLFGAFTGGWTIYLPLVLVLVGALILIRNFIRK
jgi:hypothetical protein